MKPITLLAILALLLPPAAAWGANEPCTITADVEDWGDITTLSPDTDCTDKSAAPDNDDIILAPADSDVTVVDNIAFGSDGAGFVCQDGASITANAADQDQALRFTFFDGQDTYPDGDSNVAMLLEAGCVAEFKGGFAQLGTDSPTLQETVSEALGTIWTWDQWSVCGDGDGDSADSVGGAQDCSTGSEEYYICANYNVPRNDPDLGGSVRTYIHNAMGDLQTDWMVVFLEPSMEYPHAYPIAVLDQSAPSYEICIDLRQQFTAYGQANADKPLTERISILDEADNAAAYVPSEGDTCIESNGDLLSATGDGGYAGQCLRMCDSTGANCDPWVYRISITKDDEHCDGSASANHAALHLSELTPLRKTYDTDAVFTISPFCAQAGDNFAIGAMVSFVNGDTSYADDESKIIIQSTDVTMQGVVFNGNGLIHFDGATLNPESNMIYAIDTGPVKFENMSRVDMSCWASVGGDVAGGNVAFEFADISGVTHIKDTACRYSGDWCFTTSGSAMGPATFERDKCEWISHATASNEGCINNVTDWRSIKGRHIGCIDCMGGTGGATAHAFQSATNDMLLDGVLAYGTTKGGLTAHGAGSGVKLYNVLGRGHLTNRTTLPFWGLYINRFDIRDFETTTMSVPLDPANGALKTEVYNGLLAEITTSNDEILKLDEGPSTGDTISNVTIWKPKTTNTTGTSDVILLDQDANASTVSVLEYITIGWPRGTTSDWDTAISVINDDGTEREFPFSSILVTGHHGSNVDTDYVSISLDNDIADELVNRTSGRICVDSGTVDSGGSGSYRPVPAGSSALYPSGQEPIFGFPPSWLDFESGNYVLRDNTRVADLGCGAKTGAHAPGIRANGNCWLYEQIGAECPKRPYIVNDGSGAF